MTNGYLSSEYMAGNKSNIKNTEYHDINKSFTRFSNVIIKSVDSDFIPYTPTIESYIVIIQYPELFTITYMGSTLTYTTSNGIRTSNVKMDVGNINYLYKSSSISTASSYSGDCSSFLETDEYICIKNIKSDITINIKKLYKISIIGDSNVTEVTNSDGSVYTLPNSFTTTDKSLKLFATSITNGYYISNFTVTSGATISELSTGGYKVSITDISIDSFTISLTSSARPTTTYYIITISGLSNCTATSNGTSLTITNSKATFQLASGEEATIVFSPSSGYELATSPEVTGTASSNYNTSTKSLTLSNIQSNTNISLTVSAIQVTAVSVTFNYTGDKILDLSYDCDSFASFPATSNINSSYYGKTKPIMFTTVDNYIIDSITSDSMSFTKTSDNNYNAVLTNKDASSISVNITTKIKETTYTVTINGLTNSTVYKNSIALTKVALGIDYISTLTVNGGDSLQLTVTVDDTDKYVFKQDPSISGTCTSSYSSDTGVISLSGISSNITIGIYTQDKPDVSVVTQYTNAVFYSNGSIKSSTYYWSYDSGEYKYSASILTFIIAYAICFGYVQKASYKFVFDGIVPDYIWFKTTADIMTTTDTVSTSNGYTKLTASTYKTSNTNEYIIPASIIGTHTGSQYIYFAFSGFSAYGKPTLSSVQYLVDTNNTDDGSTQSYYTGDKLLSANLLTEQSFMAEVLPYSELNFEVNDEENKLTTEINKSFVKYSEYEMYIETANATNISNDFTFYITKVGRFKLLEIIKDKGSLKHKLIGNIEYYDNIFLTEDEKKYTSYYYKTNTIKYLQMLFGSDVNTNNIMDSWQIITPFTKESKSEIARIIAQYYCMSIYENEDGKISFKPMSIMTPCDYGNGTPFCIELNQSYNFPKIGSPKEQYDSVEIQKYSYKKGNIENIADKLTIDVYAKTSDYGNMKDKSGYFLTASSKSGKYEYYDQNGNVYNDSKSISSIFNEIGNIKYFYIKLNYSKYYDIKDIAFSSFDSLPHWSKYENVTYDTLISYFFGNFQLKNYNLEITDYVDINITSEYIEMWYSYPLNDSTYLMYDLTSENQNVNNISSVDDLYYAIALNILLEFANIYGRPLETSKKEYYFCPNQSLDNPYKVDNVLVSAEYDALAISRNLLWKQNMFINQCELDWRGDGTIQVSDDILVENSRGTNNSRIYNCNLAAQVIKNEIEYDGGISSSTTVVLPNQVMYSSDESGDIVYNLLSDNLNFSTGSIPFTKEI
jgi:hypothetical protein